MLEHILKLIAQDLGFFGPTQAKEGAPSITIQIPKNHPKAESFLKLANLLATSKVTAEGVYIKGFYRPDAEQKLLEALSDFVDVDSIITYLRDEYFNNLNPVDKLNQNVKNPQWMGKILEAAVAHKALNTDNTPQNELIRLINMARADQNKSNIIEVNE